MLDDLDQRRAINSLLPDGFVKQDHAGDVVVHGFGRAEQKLPVIAPVCLSGLDVNRREALGDRAAGFIGSQQALAGRDHGGSHSVELSEVHASLSLCDFVLWPEPWWFL